MFSNLFVGDNHVIWRHGTNVLAGTNVSTYADERIQLHSDLTLEIRGMTRSDEGEYEVNKAGYDTSQPNLYVKLSIYVYFPSESALLPDPTPDLVSHIP